VATVLVTGGAGYIGSHAAKALALAGHRVIVYDNLSAGHREAVTRINRRLARETAPPAPVALVEGDIRDTPRLAAELAARGADAVMHFAAWLSVGDSVRDPAGYYANNVVGALSVLEAMRQAGVRRLVFSSTCAVYGNPVSTPIGEDHPTRPINAYGETKLAIERALPHYERAYGLRWIALRYFNAAGADPDGDLGEDHDPEIHIIPRAVDAALGRGALEVYGDDYDTPDGTCLRDYIHVDDLAAAHVAALAALERGHPSSTYNVGVGRPHSVKEVIGAVEAVLGRPVPYRIGQRRPGDPAVLFASSDRIRADLGWQPRFADLATIVASAARWRRAHPGGYRGAERAAGPAHGASDS
jgi:UDP-glucose-4-epimerase GalE